MPNSIGPLGLTTQTQAEQLAALTATYQQLYGAYINIASDTPDGQQINAYIQANLDNLDLLAQIYNSFNPQNAVGVILDQRCAINGVIRKAGTFTITNITIVTTQSVNLYGLDQTVQSIYTVSDSAGNQWQLMTTQLGVSVGTNVFIFQAANAGATITTPNTITVQVTIILGVSSVNNPTSYTTLGTNEESDANLRLRRQQSVSLASQGFYNSLFSTLLNTTGVTAALIHENFGNTTDGNGVPGHTIWVIVAGSAAPVDIANAIYTKRNAGCGMFGSQTFTITQIDGSLFQVFWDDVTPEALFIQFDATSINGITPPNTGAILAELPLLFLPGIDVEVNVNQLATLVQQIDPNTLVTNAGFSTTSMGSYTNTLSPTNLNYQFVITSGNISITIV